jgi:hypothetical protein
MAQVVIGHRLWREATRDAERFLVLERIQFMHSKPAKQIWLRLYVDWPTMQRHSMPQKNLLTDSGLGAKFELFKDPTPGSDLLCLEQVSPVYYTHRPTENVMKLVAAVRPLLWRMSAPCPAAPTAGTTCT